MPYEPVSEEKAKELPEWSEKVAQNILSGIIVKFFPYSVKCLDPIREYLDDFIF